MWPFQTVCFLIATFAAAHGEPIYHLAQAQPGTAKSISTNIADQLLKPLQHPSDYMQQYLQSWNWNYNNVRTKLRCATVALYAILSDPLEKCACLRSGPGPATARSSSAT
jgi:hypothetical protein